MVIKLTFLNKLLKKEIYMEQSKGFVDLDHPIKVCLLKKAFYGLKQALCIWNQQFHGVLLDLGFTHTRSDTGVYHWQDDQETAIIILYVNDITILGDSIKIINNIKSKLTSHYEMTDLGKIKLYLGVNITCNCFKKLLEIDQSNYVLQIINHLDYQMQILHTPRSLWD